MGYRHILLFLLAPVACGSEYTSHGPSDSSVGEVGGGGGSSSLPAAPTGGVNAVTSTVLSTESQGGATTATSVTSTPVAGSSAGGTSATTSAAPFVVTCKLPKPNTNAVPKPSGKQGNLKVVNWGGYRGAFSYTLDDANVSQIAHYSELHAQGVPFTFYLWTGKSEAANPIWAQAVKDGHELGNHTKYHTQFAEDADIDGASAFIFEKFGVQAWTMAAPYGDMTYARAAPGKFLANRGVLDAFIMPNDSSVSQYNLPCTIPNEGADVTALNTYVDSTRAAGAWRVLLIHGFIGGGDGAYHAVNLSDFIANLQYAKSLTDMWLDTMSNVAAYWIGQKLLTVATPSSNGTDLTYSWTLPEPFPPDKCVRITVDGGTVKQGGSVLPWDEHGYYEISLNAGSLTISP